MPLPVTPSAAAGIGVQIADHPRSELLAKPVPRPAPSDRVVPFTLPEVRRWPAVATEFAPAAALPAEYAGTHVLEIENRAGDGQPCLSRALPAGCRPAPGPGRASVSNSQVPDPFTACPQGKAIPAITRISVPDRSSTATSGVRRCSGCPGRPSRCRAFRPGKFSCASGPTSSEAGRSTSPGIQCAGGGRWGGGVRWSGQTARPDPRFASALARATRTGSWCAGPGKARRARYSDGPCCSARRPRRAALARRAAHLAPSRRNADGFRQPHARGSRATRRRSRCPRQARPAKARNRRRFMGGLKHPLHLPATAAQANVRRLPQVPQKVRYRTPPGGGGSP
jgi:hypothetical protein